MRNSLAALRSNRLLDPLLVPASFWRKNQLAVSKVTRKRLRLSSILFIKILQVAQVFLNVELLIYAYEFIFEKIHLTPGN
jgi:hypothetical protein